VNFLLYHVTHSFHLPEIRLVIPMAFFLLSVVCNGAGSQNHRDLLIIDSLEKELIVANDSIKAEINNKIASRLRDLGHFEKAKEYLQEALRWTDQPGAQGSKSAIYLNLGYINLQTGNYLEAITAYQKALELQEEKGNLKNQAKTLDHIGTVYKKIGNYDRAAEYYRRSLEIREQNNDQDGLSASYNNLAIISKIKKQYPQALDYYTKALKISEETGALDWQSNQLHNIGVVYEEMQTFSKAVTYYLKAAKIKEKINDHRGLVQVYQSIGAAYGKQKRFKEAIHYLTRSNELAKSMKLKPFLADNALILAEIFEQNGDYRKSLEQLKSYTVLKDSILNESNIKNINEVQTRFETERKEQENKILKQELQLKEEKNKAKNTAIFMLSLLVIALIVSMFLLFYSLKMKSKLLSQNIVLLDHEKKLKEISGKTKAVEQERLEERIFAEQELNRLQLEKLEYKSRELSTLMFQMLQKNETLSQINLELEKIRNIKPNDLNQEIDNLRKMVHDNLDSDQGWEQIKLHFQEVHPGFFSKLEKACPDLTQYDLKLCAYLRLNLSTKEIANLLNISIAGINKGRQRLRKKMNISSDTDLVEFMRGI